MEPDAVEIRVLGCLIEKQRTTPDQYPLTLNSLRLACNQTTNRNPVVSYDEATIKDALQRTYRRGWTRLASGHGSRAAKYRHLLDEALGLAGDELALLAVLMLRGPQTPGELKQRSERLHRFADLEEVEAVLARLIERGHVERIPRQPGQKEDRYRQLLGGYGGTAVAAPAAAAAPAHAAITAGAAAAVGTPAGAAAAPGGAGMTSAPSAPASAPSPIGAAAPADAARARALEQRVETLEREVAALRDQLRALRDELGA